MPSILTDLRVATRRARKRPGFTVVALLSLTLGIGANTAVFSLVNAILLRRAPIPEPERVVEIYQHQTDFAYAPFSYPDYVDLKRAGAGTFSQVSASQFTMAARDMGDHVESLTGEMVNGDYFPLLGLRAQAGRLLGPQDDVTPGAHPVVVISYEYWHRAFDGNPSAVGQTMRLNGRQYTIVGVVPKAYAGQVSGIAPAVYVPMQMMNVFQPDIVDQFVQRGNHSAFLKARLAPGASLAQVKTLAQSFTNDMMKVHQRDWPTGTSLTVVPIKDVAVNPLVDSVVVPAAALLMVVVALVLLVACANLASFLLAQARDRRKEVAIRLAIGAKRRVLVRQFLIESLVLAAVGGVAGVLLSAVALRAVLNAKLPVPLPITLDVSLDWRVLSFTILASAAAGVLFGLLPALQATRATVIETIKNENANGGPSRAFTMRNALVVGQIAVSLTLLITASLFLRSLQARATVDPGFGHSPAAMVWIAVPADRFDSTRRQLVLDEIERRVSRIPGVSTVGVTSNTFLNTLNQQGMRIHVPGVTPPKGQTAFDVDYAAADSGYLGSIGVRLVSGRNITSADTRDAPNVAVINEAMAKKFWPGREPVGQTFSTESLTFRVVGVTRTTKVRTLGEDPRPYVLTPFVQRPNTSFHVVARTNGASDAEHTATQIIGALREMDPAIMVIQASTMETHLSTMLLPARLGAVAFTLFAGLALALAVLGVYGVVSYAVARRTREVGIRLAVGAQPSALVRLLMREGFALVVVGAGLGLLLGFGAAQVMQSLLYGVGSADPLTFIGAPVLLTLVGALAAFLPARRASRVDPASVMRAE